VANTTSSRWFHRKRGLVVGITSSGGGMGVVLLAPLAAFLIDRFDWRTAFLIMGAVIWIVMTAASLWLVKDPASKGLLPDGDTPKPQKPAEVSPDAPAPRTGISDYTLREAIRLRPFWLLLLTWLSISLALHMVMVHVVPYALSLGIDPLNAAFIISLVGLCNIPGRLIVGRISDRFGRNALGTACMACLVTALLWLMHAHTLWMLYGFAVIFGFFWGGAGTMTTVLIGDIFGMRNLGSIMGIMSTAWSVGAALGPGIAGIIFDLSGHYLAAFGIAAGALFISIFFICFTSKPSD
jgi:MFS family permease